jgi:dihydroorotate dehydrogenase electron transfer subunit
VLEGDRILLIGGGVGTAPLAFLGEQAREAGIEVSSLIGFRSSEDLIFRSRFENLGDTIIATDDGSLGIHGRVAAGLKELSLEDFSQIYLCGPEMMMWDIISKTKEHAGKTQACINRYFKCAVGVCGSCCLDPDGVRVCVEGPVMMADRLLDSEFGRYRRGPSGSKGLCRG